MRERSASARGSIKISRRGRDHAECDALIASREAADMLSEHELQAFVKAQLNGGPLPRTPNNDEVQQILHALVALKQSGSLECTPEIAGGPHARVMKKKGALPFFLGALLVVGLILIGFSA